jgi:hypothetical protein
LEGLRLDQSLIHLKDDYPFASTVFG